MVSLTLAIPGELKAKMDLFEETNWSAVARRAIEERIAMLEKFRAFTAESTLTEEDALRLGRAVNKAASKRYRALLTRTSSSRRSSKKG